MIWSDERGPWDALGAWGIWYLGMTLLCRENRTSAKESGYPR